MHRPLVTSMTLALALAASTASAFDFGVLRNSPMQKFSEKDLELMKNTIQATLQSAQDNETRTWENPETGHGGSVTARAAEEKESGDCRVAKIVNHAGNLAGGGVFEFCQDDQDVWRVIGTPK